MRVGGLRWINDGGRGPHVKGGRKFGDLNCVRWSREFEGNDAVMLEVFG